VTELASAGQARGSLMSDERVRARVGFVIELARRLHQ
jgi:hypothetical protein